MLRLTRKVKVEVEAKVKIQVEVEVKAKVQETKYVLRLARNRFEVRG